MVESFPYVSYNISLKCIKSLNLWTSQLGPTHLKYHA